MVTVLPDTNSWPNHGRSESGANLTLEIRGTLERWPLLVIVAMEN
jgi:hypothetical protein